MRLRTKIMTGVAALVAASGGTAAVAATMGAGPVRAGVVYGCYSKTVTNGTRSLVLHNVGTRCPTGTVAVTWNQQGQPGQPGQAGPPGVSYGSSGSSSTPVALSQGNNLVPVLTAAPVPVSGTYYLNSSVMLIVGPGDGVACVVEVNGNEVGPFATVGDVPNLSYQTLPLTEMLYLPAGTAPTVACSGYNSVSNTSFYDGGITAVLIDSPTGNSAGRPASRVGQPARRLPALP